MKLNKNVILLVNLGSPNSLNSRAILKFLYEFLTDKRVIDLPKLLWYPILFGIILPFRTAKLLHQYQQIWLESESPLIHYTKEQAQKLSVLTNNNTLVRYAFSYAKPTIDTVLDALHQEFNVDTLTVIPLYPQFSSTTTLPVLDRIYSYYKGKYFLPWINFVNEFYANASYINAVAKSIQLARKINGTGEKLVFSYHSLPENIIKRGDVYFSQCVTTTRLIADKLQLTDDDYIIGFQSKFGRQKWIGPSTVNVLTDLACSGIKHIDIVCPGFVSDCLETLEEIAITNKQIFINAGGQKYHYINCLNDDNDFIQTLFDLI